MTHSSSELYLFARNFKQARSNALLSQKDIHESTGIATSYVSAVERGKRNITIERAGRLARAVGIPLHQLLAP